MTIDELIVGTRILMPTRPDLGTAVIVRIHDDYVSLRWRDRARSSLPITKILDRFTVWVD